MKRNKLIPLIKLIKEDKFTIIIASILLVIASIFNICAGYLNGAAIEAISKLDINKSLIYLGIYFAFSITIDSFSTPYANAMLYKIENKISRKLGYNTYLKALNLPAYSYEEKSSGEIINRITNDANSLTFTFNKLLDIITRVGGTFIILFYIFFNSWIVGIEIIIFLILLYFVLKRYNPKAKEVHKIRKNSQDKFTSLVNESIRGIREIKTLGIKKSLLSEIKQINLDIFDISNKEINMDKKLSICTTILRVCLEVGVFVTCAILMYYHKVSLTFFVAMTYYVYSYMYLMENISELSKTVQQVSVSLERVNELLENKLYKDVKFGNKKINNIKGIIEFKNITFAYPNEEDTLKNFNIKIMPNKKIAIVGASGQGKTTLFNLITRIFDPNKGQILIDGININDLEEDNLRKHVSIIRQEPFIFNRTILDNFKLLDSNIKLKDVKKYIKMAYLDEYIESLPKKYNTLLGEGGVNLSGGQKQRLSIARTLAKNSKIILFDEATSALDNSSQEFIKKAIDDLVKDHTVVIIAHRLSTIKDADIIYVIDKGKVASFGSHEELLKQSNIYQKLYKSETLNS